MVYTALKGRSAQSRSSLLSNHIGLVVIARLPSTRTMQTETTGTLGRRQTSEPTRSTTAPIIMYARGNSPFRIQVRYPLLHNEHRKRVIITPNHTISSPCSGPNATRIAYDTHRTSKRSSIKAKYSFVHICAPIRHARTIRTRMVPELAMHAHRVRNAL